jgi:hypothetical protein
MKNLFSYIMLVLFGFLLVLGTLLKLLKIISISSDWFWLLAGVALTIEGTINMLKQRQFDRKYKVVLRDEIGG